MYADRQGDPQSTFEKGFVSKRKGSSAAMVCFRKARQNSQVSVIGLRCDHLPQFNRYHCMGRFRRCQNNYIFLFSQKIGKSDNIHEMFKHIFFGNLENVC